MVAAPEHQAPENQFRTIGERADDAERLPEDEEQTIESMPAQMSDAADAEHPVEQIESLCTECMENGTTRLLLTTIPFFREGQLSESNALTTQS